MREDRNHRVCHTLLTWPMAADRSPATAPGTLSRRPGAAPIIPNIGSYHSQRSPLSFPTLLIGNPRPPAPSAPGPGPPLSCRPCHSQRSPLSFPTLLIGNPQPRHPQPPARCRPCHAAPSCPTFASVIPDVVNRESTTPAPSAPGPGPPLSCRPVMPDIRPCHSRRC